MSGELKACAHCGGRGEMDQFSPDAMDEWRVICADKSCEAWGPEASTRDAAITAWNRRAPGWKGIESAPRDGTQFLALVSNGWHALVSAPAEALREGWPYQWWRSSDRQSYPVVDTHPEGYNWSHYSTLLLTHWQPLPAAPADGGK